MKKYGIALGVVLAIAATAGNAQVQGEVDDNAADFKMYSAAGCGASNHAKANVTKAGSVFNTGAAVNYITCPVTLDRFSGRARHYYLKVLRKPGAAEMICYLSLQIGNSVTTTTGKAEATGITVLDFSSTVIADSAALGCAVPAKVASGASGIKHYYVWEY
jgi:hypothetical protein